MPSNDEKQPSAAPVQRSIVVVGASAGGIEALRQLVASLPADLEAAVCVVLHISATGASVLPAILSRAGRLPASSAVDGEAIRPGRIYVAPPDHHLLVHEGIVRLERGPKEHRSRPAVDPLFRSAAEAYGNRAIAVVLSGTLGDGALGLRAVKARGGVTVVQDPKDALFDSMPRAAMEMVQVDHVAPMREMGPLIVRLCHEGVVEKLSLSEPAWSAGTMTCPDCGGMLSEQDENGKLRFRCRVGHAFGSDTLLEAQGESIETALFMAARALAEKAAFLRQLGTRAQGNQRTELAQQFLQKAQTFERRRDLVLRFVTQRAAETPEEVH